MHTESVLPVEPREDSLVAKIAALTSLQSIVSRMASNSQQMKNWSVTIVTAFIAIESKLNGLSCLSYLIPLLITFLFSYLDAYYLSQERIFRDVYNKLSKIPVGDGDNYLDFEKSIIEMSKIEKNSIVKCYKSNSIKYFYIPLLITSLLVLLRG